MNTLIVGIDVSRKDNHVCALSGSGEQVASPRCFRNDREGFTAMRTWLGTLMGAGGFDALLIGGEATGLLWFHTFWQWQETGDIAGVRPQLYLLNAQEVRHFKKVLRDRDKTDPKDAYAIAEWLRFGHLPHTLHLDARYLPLQRLTRYRYHLVQDLAREKIHTRHVAFALKMNTYGPSQPFRDPFAKSGQWALTHYATLDDLLDDDLDELAAELTVTSRGRLDDPHASAAHLQQLTAAAYPLPAELIAPVNTILVSQLAHITFLQRQLADLSRHMATLAAALPGCAHLDSIPGIGRVYAAGLVAEIQAPHRFMTDPKGQPRSRHGGQAALAKFAGLWWPRSQSGDFEAQDRRLAKSGNRYLRYYLVEAANSVRQREPAYAAFYARKHAEATCHQHHRAIVLTARKLVNLVFALLLEDRDYQRRGGQLAA